MEKQKLLKEVNKLLVDYNGLIEPKTDTEKIEIIADIERILKEYLSIHPQDSDIWLKLSRLYRFLYDDISTNECLNTVLEYEPHNAQALILLASFADSYPGITKEIFQKLCEFYSSDEKIMSMIEYLKGKYFLVESFSNKKYELPQEQEFKRSIELCDKYVWNHVQLAHIYINRHELAEARELLISALSNIKRVSGSSDYYDFLSVERYINELVTGIWINTSQYNHILALLCNFTLDRSLPKVASS